ncbi:serine hydrolase [Leucobacter sp. BZR 635]
MQRTHTSIAAPLSQAHRDPASLGYGLGLFVSEDRRFGRMADHSGGLPGFSSHMRWHVESGVGTVAFGNSDAFKAETLAVAAHARLLEGGSVPSARVVPWPEAVSAAELIDDLLRAGQSLRGAERVFATNVLTDVPAEVRDRRIAGLADEVGTPVAQAPVAARLGGTTDAAQLRWRVECERGALVCDLRMIGLDAPLVQSLAVAIASESARKPAAEEPSIRDRAEIVLPRNAGVPAGSN